ncbi:hypothetical protein [Xenorhabdus miraniensis]|uniref:N-acetyltransferase n=1 Tax=Xenorhabdus miraniensis TaxID=351674 RepID=A0A2D0JVV8_9GAMM|nr:hypothetical protein [Xenorhabdus miraniensis]PHM50456.1 N-acetyltransferase [Xenorhabdus miraniensis]
MFKKAYSFNKEIEKMQSNSLARSKNLSTSLPDNLSNIDINKQMLIHKLPFIASIEVSLQVAENAINKLLNSIREDKWLDHIEDTEYTWRNIEDKKLKTPQDLWDLRCCITEQTLISMRYDINEHNRNTEKYFYFVCYIQTIPIGIIQLKHYDIEKQNSLTVNNLITHPGIKNCSYLLMEKAVNKSYEMDFNGKLQLMTATDELNRVYHRMGFIDNDDYMTLDPNGNNFWTFYTEDEVYKFNNSSILSI